MELSIVVFLGVLVLLVMLVVRIGAINRRMDEMEDVMADKPSRSYVNRLVSGKTDPRSDSESESESESSEDDDEPRRKKGRGKDSARSSRSVRFDES